MTALTARSIRTAGLGLIATVMLSAAAIGPAAAKGSMSIVNCTQTNVRVFFYNNSDVMMSIAKSAIDIDAGNAGTLSVTGTGKSKARVFKRQLLDNPVLIQSNLGHNDVYFLTAKHGEWRLSGSNAFCH